MHNKILIIGGVAGGATTAARLRRLDDHAEIILFERGEYISFANCGLPYHIGGVIKSRDALLVQTIEDMQKKFNIDIRNFSEVIAIDTTNKKVTVRENKQATSYEESYDKLIISTGSQPVKPPINGIENAANLFTLRNIPDMDKILAYIKSNQPKNAVVIGGGFIGIEMMENLAHLGLHVTVIEMANQVMAMFDYEMAQIIHRHIADKGVNLILSDGVKSFADNGKTINLNSGKSVTSDLTIFAIGVKPDNSIAKAAGIQLSERGGIKIDGNFMTSAPDVYAIGDVVEIPNLITNKRMLAALAGPANKQARFIANHIYGISDDYAGTLATSAAKIFDINVASTGISEKMVLSLNLPFESIHIHPNSHASYYPGAEQMSLKVIYNPETREIYGAQAIGGEGVDKRIDVIATAIYAKLKVDELKNLDLAYAPPFSSAKDPVNMIGFVADNKRNNLVSTISWQEMQTLQDKNAFLLDVREKPEYLIENLPNSINIPLSELRGRLNELPKNQMIYVFCHVGIRGYTATRILLQNGFEAKNLDGGLKSYSCVYDHNGSITCYTPTNEHGVPHDQRDERKENMENKAVVSITVDACGLQCPGPIVQVYKTMNNLNDGDVIEVKATDPGFMKDIQAWADKTGNTLLDIALVDKVVTAHLRKGKTQTNISSETKGYQIKEDKNGTTIVVFSQDLDKAIAAFIIASGAKSMGKNVSLFFTFWGLNILRKAKKVHVKKTFIEKMFGFMMPRGVKKLPISNMNMLGMGPKMIKMIMKKKNVDSLQVLMENAMAMGVKIIACAMSMDIMGIKKEELMDGIEVAGVATYLADTQDANHNLFI